MAMHPLLSHLRGNTSERGPDAGPPRPERFMTARRQASERGPPILELELLSARLASAPPVPCRKVFLIEETCLAAQAELVHRVRVQRDPVLEMRTRSAIASSGRALGWKHRTFFATHPVPPSVGYAPTMRRYIHVDHAELRSLYEQIEGRQSAKKRRKSVGLSIAGPRVDVTEEDRDASAHEMIGALVEALRARQRLATERPRNVPWEFPQNFVLETFDAIKVVLPRKVVEPATDVATGLVVWIADPVDGAGESRDPYMPGGTFLYLTEARLDGGDGRQTTFSGCSALQAVANAAQGKPFLAFNPAGEPLGRQTYEHPVKKLVGVGGMATGEVRRLEALYSIRYMTNEQCYVHNGTELRGHDLLGYPIYIADGTR